MSSSSSSPGWTVGALAARSCKPSLLFCEYQNHDVDDDDDDDDDDDNDDDSNDDNDDDGDDK